MNVIESTAIRCDMATTDKAFRQACADGDAELIEQLLKLGVRNRSWALASQLEEISVI